MISKKFVIAIIIVLIASLSFYLFSSYGKETNKTLVTAARVIDGDTIELANGKNVRLLGIDAPEKGHYGYEEAKDKLKELVLGKSIVLEKDVNNADRLGRLLRYIFVGDIFVNLEMVKQGYANVYIVLPDSKYEKELKQAEDEARSRKIGIWKLSEFSDCITISSFHYNAKGNDTENLNGEYVVLKNNCNFSIDTGGWTIKDRTFNVYIFQKFELDSENEVKIHSGDGVNTLKELYWNNKFPVWDNSGDTLYLRDEKGSLVLIRAY